MNININEEDSATDSGNNEVMNQNSNRAQTEDQQSAESTTGNSVNGNPVHFADNTSTNQECSNKDNESSTKADPGPRNPYKKSQSSSQHGILHATPQGTTISNKPSRSGGIDKQIMLKKVWCAHISLDICLESKLFHLNQRRTSKS